MAWPEVIHSLATMGLGAVIAAVTAVVTLVLANNHEKETRKLTWRREILDQVASDFNSFVATFEDYAVSCPLRDELSDEHKDWAPRVRRQLAINTLTASDVRRKADASHEKVELLAKAMTSLRLLKHKGGFDAMHQYKAEVENFWLQTSQQLEVGVNSNEFVGMRKAISACKGRVFDELAARYPVE